MKSQLTKWQTDRMANWQNRKLAKYQVIEIAIDKMAIDEKPS